MSESAVARDEVDRIIESWREQRPDLDVSPMQIFSRISRLSRHFDLARRAAFSAHDLEPWAFDVLSSLRRTGDPYCLTPGALMSELLVSSGTMTNRIDRLEQQKLVQRVPSVDDRRTVQVRLTDLGIQRVDETLVELVRSERGLAESLSEDERQELAGMLRRLNLAFENR